MKKFFSALFLGVLLSVTFVPSLVSAQDATDQPTSLLPTDTGTGVPEGYSVDCIRFLKRPSLKKEVAENKTLRKGEAKISFLDANGKKTTESFDVNAREMALSCG